MLVADGIDILTGLLLRGPCRMITYVSILYTTHVLCLPSVSSVTTPLRSAYLTSSSLYLLCLPPALRPPYKFSSQGYPSVARPARAALPSFNARRCLCHSSRSGISEQSQRHSEFAFVGGPDMHRFLICATRSATHVRRPPYMFDAARRQGRHRLLSGWPLWICQSCRAPLLYQVD